MEKNERYKFSQIKEKGQEKDAQIIYENREIELPCLLGDLAFFVDEGGDKSLETEKNHHRAAWLSRVGVKDKIGNIFFQITAKGVGFLYPENYESKKDDYSGEGNKAFAIHSSVEDPWGYKVLGLFDRRNAEILKNNAQELNHLGIRCEAIAGIMSLKKIIHDSRLIDLDELRRELKKMALEENLKSSMVNDLDGFEPAEVIRLVRENTRVKDFCEAGFNKRKEMLGNVFKTLNLENEIKGGEKKYFMESDDSIKQYLEDFFKQAGKNLAIMHSNGKMMSYLNSGNITLSLAEIVDLDSIISLDKGMSAHITPHPEWLLPKGYVKDARDMLYALGRMFIDSFDGFIKIDQNLRENLRDIFLENYFQLLEGDKLKKYKIDIDKLKQMAREFAEMAIKNNQRIAPIKL